MIKYVVIGLWVVVAMGCGNSNSGFENETKDETAVVQEATTPVNTNDTIVVTALGANMSEMKFDVKSIKVPANKEITFALVNESTDATMPHNIVFIQAGTANDVGQAGYKFLENAYVAPDDKNVIAHSPLAQINETVYFSFTTPNAGEYEFICSYPGHWGMMKGKFVTE